MLSENSPVQFNDPLPASVDVVIIGAGVIGVSTAWFLQRQGLSVLVCEKGRVAGEQSSRNWGWVRQQGRDAAELPIMMESLELWSRLSKETGEDLGFARQGVMYLAQTQSELDKYETWLETAKQHQLDSHLLSAGEVDNMIDTTPGQTIGALYTPSDARAEPFKAVPGLARAAQRQGVSVIENCAVRTVETSGGKVSAVITEKGQVQTNTVICAGGAWASLFLRNLGIDMPQLIVKSSVARTAPAPEIFNGNAAFNDLSFRRRDDGGYTIALGDHQEHLVGRDSFRYFSKFLPILRASKSKMHLRFGEGLWQRMTMPASWQADTVTPFEKARVLNPAANTEVLKRMRQRIVKRLPRLADVPFAESWAGMIDVTPDAVPIMDEIEKLPGLYLAAGFSGHGFGIGPGAGRIMADMVQGKPLAYDMNRFRLSRFSDGSPLQMGPI